MANSTDQPPDESGQPPCPRNRIRDAVWSVDMGVALALTGAFALVALSRRRSMPLAIGEHARFDLGQGVGSVVQCADKTWSHAGGRQGACSYHGGVAA
jgi:hypothetical protein